jgi:outer membrane receptor protein involved in Fe transport
VVIDPNLYDIERVEVLRGPQGTLYGSGSLGGTVRIITAQPNLQQIQASVDVSGSGTDGANKPNGSGNVMVNIPLVADQLALRVVASENYDAGWIDRDIVGNDSSSTDWHQPNPSTRFNVLSEQPSQVIKDVNDTNTQNYRATLTWQPTDSLTITPMFMNEVAVQGGYNAFDSVPGTLAHYQPFNTAESISDNFHLGSLTAKYAGDGFDITSATAYWNRTENQFQDGSENLAVTLGASPYVNQGGFGSSVNNELDTSHQFTEELRIASDNQSRFSWLGGVFYQYFRSTFDLTEPTPALPTAAPGETDGSNLITILEPTTIKQIAVFGEASYQILNTLKFTSGLRYYDFNTNAYSFQNGFLFGGTTLDNVTVPLKDANSGINPKFNLSWTPDDALLVYATIAKGFRPAGVNQPTSTSFGCPVTPLNYKADSVWSYELGEKASLLGGRLTFNADGYYENWHDVQNLVYLACGFTFTTNASSAGIYGGEAEAAFHIIPGSTNRDGLTFNLNGSITHASYSADSPAAGIAKGDPLLNIPHFTSAASLTYGQFLPNEMLATVRVDYNYVGPRSEITLVGGDPAEALPGYQSLPSYFLADARAALSKDNWTLSLFANNLTNKHAALSYLNINSFNLYSYNRVATNQPRTIGLELSYKY